MTTAERIFQEVSALPETQAQEVLDFVSLLKSRSRDQSARQDTSTFDSFGAVYEGRFNRDELYDRKVLR